MMPSRVVLGIEADVSSGGRKAVNITDASGTSSNQTNVFDSETVRGRLGYAFDNVLLYGTGGWAWSSNQYIRTQLTGALNLATAGTDEAMNTYLSGWTAGGGVAVAFAQNWNVFAEYRYTNYGSPTVTLPFSQLVHDFGEQGQRGRCRGELQIQLEGAAKRRRDAVRQGAGASSTSRTAPVYKSLPAAAFDRLERGLYRRRRRL